MARLMEFHRQHLCKQDSNYVKKEKSYFLKSYKSTTYMHTKQDAANCHYPTLLQAAESAKDMGDAITKWLSRSDDVHKDDRADKTKRTVRRGGSRMINPIKLDYEHYSLHHYCLRWTTLEC
jgi:hypothetical protein